MNAPPTIRPGACRSCDRPSRHPRQSNLWAPGTLPAAPVASAGHVLWASTHGPHSPNAPPASADGRIKRDPAARRAFQRQDPCPATGKQTGACPGYVEDHIVPLKRGGADKAENMQWQTKEAAKSKDRIE